MNLENILVLLGYVLLVAVIIFFVIYFYKEYKNTKDDGLQVLMIILLVAVAFPVAIYYLDRFNVFSKLGYLSNVDSGSWQSFLSTYSSSLISALISAVFLVVVTGMQIERSKEDNDDLSKKQLRLQNIPVLKFKADCNVDINVSPTYSIDSNLSDNRNIIPVRIHIDNIGLGIAQNVYYSIVINSSCKQDGIQNEQIIYKDKNLDFTFYFNVPAISNYYKYLLFLVYYEDVLGNKYVQKLSCNINSYDLNDSSGKISSSCSIAPLGKNKYVTDQYSYMDEKEYQQMKDNEEHDKEQNEISKLVKNKKELDLRISEFFEDDINVLKLISDYFKDEFPLMEGGGSMSGLKLVDNKYVAAVATYSMGVKPNEYIEVARTLTLDLNTLAFVSSDLKVIKNTLKISATKIKKFEKYLEKVNNKKN